MESLPVLIIVIILVLIDVCCAGINTFLKTTLLNPKYHEEGEEWAHTTHTMGIAILWIFLVEQILHLIAFGWGFFHHWWYVMDLIVVVISLVCEVVLEHYFHHLAWVEALIILRLWKVVVAIFDIFLAHHEAEEAEEQDSAPTAIYKSPIADPIIDGKLLARALKLLKKAVQDKQCRRGVPECTKALRKGMKGICFIAADVYPIDIVAHLPILCEEKDVPYCYVKSRTELGAACQTRRSVSLVMVLAPKDDSAFAKTYEQVIAGVKAVHPYL